MRKTYFNEWLTTDHRAIFSEVLGGMPSRQIAVKLGLTHSQVEAMIRQTCRRLDVRQRKDAAVLIAMHLGWTLPEGCRPIDDNENLQWNGQLERSQGGGMITTESIKNLPPQLTCEAHLNNGIFISSIINRLISIFRSNFDQKLRNNLDWNIPIFIALVTACIAISLSAITSVLIGIQQILEQ